MLKSPLITDFLQNQGPHYQRKEPSIEQSSIALLNFKIVIVAESRAIGGACLDQNSGQDHHQSFKTP
jgi:hypothetical protein